MGSGLGAVSEYAIFAKKPMTPSRGRATPAPACPTYRCSYLPRPAWDKQHWLTKATISSGALRREPQPLQAVRGTGLLALRINLHPQAPSPPEV